MGDDREPAPNPAICVGWEERKYSFAVRGVCAGAKFVHFINIRKIAVPNYIVVIRTLLKNDLFVNVCGHKMIQMYK